MNKIPVILITGESVASSEGRAYNYGVADVMHKPFYPHIVMRRSSNIIELYQNKINMEQKLKRGFYSTGRSPSYTLKRQTHPV